MACSRRCAGVLGVCALVIAIALGVGLGVGLRKDDDAAGIYVYGDTTLTGFNKAEFESSASNALNFRKGVAALSSTVNVADVSITSVTDVARRRRRNALRRMLAVTSRVNVDFSIKAETKAEQTTVKSAYVAVTPTALLTALTAEGLSVTSVTTITATESAPSPSATPPATPPATGVTELVGVAKKNAVAAALQPKPVTLVPAAGLNTSVSTGASRERFERRSLVQVEALDTDSFASTSDYKTHPKSSTYVESMSDTVFYTPNMILCFINSCNWTENLNTGAYIAELDPYHCDNSEGDRVKGKVQYRWIVNASGPELGDDDDARTEYKVNVWVHLADNDNLQYVNTQLVIKKDDIVIKGEEVFVKNLTFTYKTPVGTPEQYAMKGFVQTLCDIGAEDSKCASETIRYFEQIGPLAFGATARDSSSGTKAVFLEPDFETGEYLAGRMVSDDAHTKMTYRGREVCDKLDDRGYFGVKYTVFDENGKRVSLLSNADLISVGTATPYRAFMFYPGSVYVDTYTSDGEMDASTKAAALAAFQDGDTVKEIIDFDDPDSAVTKKLRVRRGVLYKMTSVDAPVSTYKDAIVVGWTSVFTAGNYQYFEIQIKYDSSAEELRIVSKREKDNAAGTLGTNTISTPRALTMEDLNNEPLSVWGSIFGRGSATLLNLTHYTVASAETVQPGSLASDLTLTCGSECADASKFSNLQENESREDMIFASPMWNDARSTYKEYTFKKDDAMLFDGATEVVYDPSNTNFNWDSNGVFMTLFEASSENVATLDCAAPSETCWHASKLSVYYEWRSSPYASMSWLEDPNDANDKKFMVAPLQLQGQMPTDARAIPPTPSGANYAGANLNLQYEGGWMSGTPQTCFNPRTGERKTPTYDSYGGIRCTDSSDEVWWTRPDVVIPDGTTLQEPSTSKKYVVKVDAAVELLVRAESTACDSLTYATDIEIPTASDYADFTMPSKPDIATLKVKGTDKM